MFLKNELVGDNLAHMQIELFIRAFHPKRCFHFAGHAAHQAQHFFRAKLQIQRTLLAHSFEFRHLAGLLNGFMESTALIIDRDNV